MEPVVLQMDIRCEYCHDSARKIRKALENIPGVENVTPSFETNRVVVKGTANAEVLRRRLETKMRKSVTILSDGLDEPPARSRRAPSPPPPTPAPPTPPPRYWPQPYPPNCPPTTYAPNYPPPPLPNYHEFYPYGSNDELALFSDENPHACSIQ